MKGSENDSSNQNEGKWVGEGWKKRNGKGKYKIREQMEEEKVTEGRWRCGERIKLRGGIWKRHI